LLIGSVDCRSLFLVADCTRVTVVGYRLLIAGVGCR
jgi:hypothetical protein